MKDLLDAGVHFGHRGSHWNPKMKRFIFMKRRGVHIINLQKTLILFEQAYNYIKNVTANGGRVLFVGTKKQARAIVTAQSERCGQFYIHHHWIGGLLTNFKVVRTSIDKIDSIEKILNDEDARQKYLKRDLVKLEKTQRKLRETFEGVREMKKLPDLVFLVDAHAERSAVQEAQAMGIPICAMVDTNSSPDGIDMIIPSNDDAIRSIQVFMSRVADAVIAGKSIREASQAENNEVLQKYKDSLPEEAIEDATSTLGGADKENLKKEQKTKKTGETPEAALKSDPSSTAANKTKSEGKATSEDKSKSATTSKVVSEDKKEKAKSKSSDVTEATPDHAGKTVAEKPPAKETTSKKDKVEASASTKAEATPTKPPSTTAEVSITPQAVKELRELSQAGMMECKKALVEAGGDQGEAMRILKERGMALAEKKKLSREANEGIIYLKKVDTKTLALPVFCETDFVAKNKDFVAYVEKLGEDVLKEGVSHKDSEAVQGDLAEIVSKLREKIEFGEPVLIEDSKSTFTASYLHTNKKVAGIVTAELPENESEKANASVLAETLHDIALQITAMNPLALAAEDISAEQREAERGIFLKQMEDDDKSDEIKQKIVEGKLKKYFAERCLLEMNFVKDPKLTVTQYLKAQAAACGVSTLKLTQMHYIVIGADQ